MSVPYDASNFGARPNNDGEATAKVASPSGEMVKKAYIFFYKRELDNFTLLEHLEHFAVL